MGRLESLLGVMQLSDSALPTGAFSHSLGFETYMARGQLETEEEFAQWMQIFIEQQLTYTDAIAIREVYRAETFEDVADLDELLTVSALPSQVREASITMGKRLLAIGMESYEGEWVQEYSRRVKDGEMFGHTASVWGVLARTLDVPADEAVTSHLYACTISLTQNAVRAIPLGQNAGQRIIRRAQSWVLAAVKTSRALNLEDLGAVSPGLEIAQMHHERQRARLFMS